ncbi:hypothetical protein BU25DRAFT_431087 [Macroventuria anomochaeta]|uniref:Uncharacterized protein n=1 Tax=Macroventuria anomochaeta TaxID=301207 RepID=A0ACB6S2X7_9PLEO|nr:uncharacterized protein BU25DRAFT_431087 [Macroventuria anomochaeta]KAF2627743.1 hypothetical protein BU25DRAFT_431087 [Macroventuria anomochaeta]
MAIFDWTDSKTWPAAFSHQLIKAGYMMEPQVARPWAPMIEFFDFAVSNCVERFVLCAGTTAELGKNGMGRVWDAFIERKVEFCVLRPSWFMGRIFTACQDGQIPFVIADDIADVASRALTNSISYDCDLRILGPELLTYDDVAARFSEALDRPIEHVKLDKQGRYENLVQAGLSEYYARFFTNTTLNSVVEHVTEHRPKSFDEFIREYRAVWLA